MRHRKGEDNRRIEGKSDGHPAVLKMVKFSSVIIALTVARLATVKWGAWRLSVLRQAFCV